MKHFFKSWILLVAVSLTIISCNNDDDNSGLPTPQGKYDLGYIISNEGNFGSPNASLSFLSADFATLENGIYANANNGNPLGDVLNHFTTNEDFAFLVLNNSNKIEVVNRFTFEKVATISEEIELPRFAAADDNVLYISNSGSQSITVYSLTDFSLLRKIELNKSVEQLELTDNYLFVQNASFGTGKEITPIKVSDFSVEQAISLPDNIKAIEEEDDILYVLHQSGVSKFNINSKQKITTIPFADGFTGVSKFDVEDNFIYFTQGSSIYKNATNANIMTATALVDTNADGASWGVGYGFAVEEDHIFYTDVNGFTENSDVMIYNLEGELIQSITTGIGANGVEFND